MSYLQPLIVNVQDEGMEHKTLINLFRCHGDFKGNVTATVSSRLLFHFLKSGRRIQSHAYVKLRLMLVKLNLI